MTVSGLIASLLALLAIAAPSVRAQPVNEFARPEVARLVEASHRAVMTHARLFEPISDEMRAIHVDDWPTCLTEHIVRAGAIRDAVARGDAETAARLRREGVGDSFIYLVHAVKMLGMFDLNRATYPSLAAYFPDLVASLGAAEPVDVLPEFWHYVDAFSVAGPFPLEWDGTWSESDPGTPSYCRGFNRPYGPEADASLNAQFATVDGPAGWKQATSRPRDHVLELHRSFTTTDNVVCYARVVILAPRGMRTDLGLGSNDGGKLWFDNAWIFADSSGGRATPNDHRIPVALKPGPNPVMVKVANLGLRWEVVLSVLDPHRELRIIPHETARN